MEQHKTQAQASYDVSIVRPQKGLRTLHTLELMATTIYRFQISRQKSELNRQLVAAMCNEMTHYQDFQVKLYEFGFRPNIVRWAFWMVGFVFGFGSRLLGSKAMLKTGIWVETKAVHHYGQLLETIDWDDQTRKVIEKDQADEDGHINRWKKFLETGVS
ncbi:MAG: demethoxyubiquinone hydroxylase family protein [Planctomycetota bacterium]|jgi:ubiquinone biosynthesis monooxygenase Coq7